MTTHECDTPGCDGTRSVVTPDGYVCDECADDIATRINRGP